MAHGNKVLAGARNDNPRQHEPDSPLATVVTTSGALSALADDTRREILTRLASGPQPAGQVARGFRMSQPAVSKHLRVLRQSGLVVSHKAGRQRVYGLSPDGMTALRRILADLSRMWAVALPAFKDFVDNEQHTPA
jgi:DNA-binding transcriptional ArsR family regulator